MEKKNIIPPLPEGFKIDPVMVKLLEAWVNRFKEMSPRILVMPCYDHNFNMDLLSAQAKELIDSQDPEDIIFEDWPKQENIAFLVEYDDSLPGSQKRYLSQNTYVFCYGDTAFGLGYFEYQRDCKKSNGCDYYYGLGNYPDSALSWSYVFTIIKTRLIELEQKVPALPNE